ASADKPQLRLRLIDRPNRNEIHRIRKEIETRVTELRNLGSRLRTIRGDLEKRKLEIRDIDQFRAELGQVIEKRPELPPTLEEQHSLYVQRQRLLEALSEVQAVQRKVLADLLIAVANREKLTAVRASLQQVS